MHVANLIMTAGCLTCLGVPAFAGSPSTGEQRAVVELRGVVAPRCEISVVDDVRTETGFVLVFDVYCNTDFALNVRSVNGALKSNIGGRDADQVGYGMMLHFPGSDVESRSLLASDGPTTTRFSGMRSDINVGSSAFAGSGEIHVTLDPTSQQGESIKNGLRAGDYTDVVEITLVPRD